MDHYTLAVEKIIAIYVNTANALPNKEVKVFCITEKIFCITGLFDYLSTAEVKPILKTERFARIREILLKKIQEFSTHFYVLAYKHRYHHLISVMNELFTYLTQDASVPRRRSERQKQLAVRTFNRFFETSSNPECISVATELKYWSAIKPNQVKPVSIKVKVLPRRSARLLARRE